MVLRLNPWIFFNYYLMASLTNWCCCTRPFPKNYGDYINMLYIWPPTYQSELHDELPTVVSVTDTYVAFNADFNFWANFAYFCLLNYIIELLKLYAFLKERLCNTFNDLPNIINIIISNTNCIKTLTGILSSAVKGGWTWEKRKKGMKKVKFIFNNYFTGIFWGRYTNQNLSPRIFLARIKSLCIMVTRFEWTAHMFASSKKETIAASVASCSASKARGWNLKSVE